MNCSHLVIASLALLSGPAVAQLPCPQIAGNGPIGVGSAGTGGAVPSLDVDGILFPGGPPVRLVIEDALPGAVGTLFVGTSVDPMPLPAFGATAQLSTPIAKKRFVADAQGTAEIVIDPASVMTCGATLVAQVAVVDAAAQGGLALSNGVEMQRGSAPINGPLYAGQMYEMFTVPTDVELADVTGDGVPDLLATQNAADAFTLAVRPAQGDGRFGPIVYSSVGNKPLHFVVADLDVDGAPDVIARNGSTSPSAASFSVSLGNGDGTFGSPSPYASGLSPGSFAVGDVDGDLVPDVIVSVAGSSPTRLLTGNGDGTLGPAHALYAPEGAAENFLDDVDLDGALDLVRRIYGSGEILVRLGNGDATFRDPLSYTASTDALSLALGDMNGDGFTDLVTAQEGAALNDLDVGIRLGMGDGTFGAMQLFPALMDFGELRLADLDADGNLDVVLSDEEDEGSVFALLGAGDGTLGAPSNYRTGRNVSSMSLGDVNGDGFPELAVGADFAPGTLSVFLGDGDGGFETAETAPTGGSARRVDAGDVNDDGHLDLVAANEVTGEIVVFFGDGEGGLGAPATFPAGAATSAVALAHLDGDGMVDAVVTNASPRTVSVLLGTGGGTFGAPTSYSVGSAPRFVAVADLDGDGANDVVAANRLSADLSVLLGNGDGTLQAAQEYGVGTKPYGVAIGDLDGDGVLDMVSPSDDDTEVGLLFGIGDGTFEPAQFLATGIVTRAVALADVDDDGALDIVAPSTGVGTIVILLGAGDGSFAAPANYPTVDDSYLDSFDSVVVDDLTGDGVLDVVAGATGGNGVSIFPGLGDGSFGPTLDFVTNLSPSSVLTCDFDEDGLTDIVFSTNFSGTVSILRSRLLD